MTVRLHDTLSGLMPAPKAARPVSREVSGETLRLKTPVEPPAPLADETLADETLADRPLAGGPLADETLDQIWPTGNDHAIRVVNETSSQRRRAFRHWQVSDLAL